MCTTCDDSGKIIVGGFEGVDTITCPDCTVKQAKNFLIETIILEGEVTLNKADGGAALISDQISEGRGNSDSGIYVRICSWDDDFCYGRTSSPNHKDIESLRGKRVRVTVEII